MLRVITRVAVLLAVCIAIGCSSSINLEVRRATPLASERNTSLLAGVGRADITPRPGMPMAGYSANANYGKGFRTRPYARVIYLKSVDKGPVALVQCDLLTGSELVHRRVAELVALKLRFHRLQCMASGGHGQRGHGRAGDAAGPAARTAARPAFYGAGKHGAYVSPVVARRTRSCHAG